MREISGRFLGSRERHQIAFSREELFLDGTVIIRKYRGHFEPAGIDFEQKFFCSGDSEEAVYLIERLQKIANLLENDQYTEALTLAASTKWSIGNIRQGWVCSDLERYNFDPLEPRDRLGQWTKEEEQRNSDIKFDIAYPGTFHDQLLADAVQFLRGKGDSVVTEVRLTGINGITARADAIVRPAGGAPYILEVKTGADPPFTPQQDAVYPLVCAGPHAISPDARISQVGFAPGALLPKMDVWIVYTAGPGHKTIYFNGCDIPAIWRH